jgi:hypothetical protein
VEIFKMPMFGTPVAASRREPARTVRLPEGVKRAIIEMVETGADFISAAKSNGLQPQTMRRWLGRAEAISFLRKERSRFRAAACASNEAYLVSIRGGDNAAAAVHAIRTLEQLADNELARPSNVPDARGVTIRIVNVAPQPALIDITPRPPLIDASRAVSSHGLPNQDE